MSDENEPSDVVRVHGTVLDADGSPVPGARVTLWRRRLRERDPLGQAETDDDGDYAITAKVPDRFAGRVLVSVEAVARRLRAPLESDLLVASDDLEVDLQQPARDPSDYGRLRRAIDLQLGTLSITELVESDEHQDVTFLVKETGRTAEDIVRVLIAARLEARVDIAGAAFYAFLAQHIPATLPDPLLEATDRFQLIDSLVQRIASLIFALAPETQTQALTSAAGKNIVDPGLGESIPSIVEALQAHRSTELLNLPFQVGKATLGELLAVADLPTDKHEVFARSLAANTQSMRAFWRSLTAGDQGLTADEASAVQRTLELGAFVKNHIPLVRALQGQFQRGTYSSLADLARLPLDDWTRLVEQVGPPPNVTGTSDAAPAEVYARVVYTRVTRAYPTAALASRIATMGLVPEPERPGLVRFFADNPSLDLVKTTVSAYLAQNGDTALNGIAADDRATVVDNVKRLQRLLRITQDVDHTQALLTAGLGSATQIVSVGSQQFFTQAVAAGLTKVEANRIFRTASQRYANVIALHGQLNRDMVGLWPKAVGALSDLDDPTAQAVARDQSLATLFGSQDYCAVDDCASVLSPAAYLCDLLLWLRGRQLSGPFPTALAALFARRPDLGHLLLNCDNTETPLPYIDLVNELLEDAVAPPVTAVWKQTTESADELRAAPEYVNTAAYDTLRQASYPPTLPYDKPLDELRTILAQSGITLWQLRQWLLHLDGGTLDGRFSVAAEHFHLDPHEQDLVTHPDFVSAATAWNTPAPPTDLVPVEAFLRAAAISYEQLLELLEVAWVRAGGPALTLQGLSDTCDLSVQTLAPDPLDAAVLDRAHRFLRMWRHAGRQMWELDQLVGAPAVANGVLDAAAVVALFTFDQLLAVTGLAVDEQLAFYADIDTTPGGHRTSDGTRVAALYTRLFLNPAVPADPDLLALRDGDPIALPNLADHLPALQSALALSSADAEILFGAPVTDGQLTLSNLSTMYRVTRLAAAAGSSLEALLRIIPLTAAATLDGALTGPAETLNFLNEIKQIAQSGFDVDHIVYVLTTLPTPVAVTDEQVQDVTLPAVRAAVAQTHNEIFTSADPPVTILQRELAQVPPLSDPAQLAEAIAIVADTFVGSTAARNTFIAAAFAAFVDPAVAQAELAPLPVGLTPAQRQAAVDGRAISLLTPLATYLTRTRVIAAVAPGLGLQPDLTAVLANLDVPGTTSTVLDQLTSPHLIDTSGGDFIPLTRANFPGQYLAVQLLDKTGTVVKALRLGRTELAWLIAHPTVYGGLDLAQLPVTSVQSTQPLDALLRTSLVVKLARASGIAPTASPQDLYGLLAGVADASIADASAAQTALAAITGWRLEDIAALAGAVGATFTSDYTDPRFYDRLRTLMALLGNAAASASQLVAWSVADPTEDTATSALAALEARYSRADWLALAPTITDPIRERRSAALQAYLIGQRDGAGQLVYGDADALFDAFLIDVQMSSCEVTTRVVQAYAAVQLFVERCLMGLENGHGVVVDVTRDDGWTQWRWMKRYRIWEAAREVFLYPENWLIESQRPNATEIFATFQQDVRQNESTVDHLETAAENYIQGLDELAHLTVTGTCRDPQTGDVHVVARTVADPPRYYHRVFHNRAWTGWERVGVDIKAPHAVPALFRGRLCLFWLDVVVANEPRQNLPPAAGGPSPSQEVARYVSLGFNFTVRRSGAWTPAQRAKGHLFDIPLLSSASAGDARAVEALYTLKVHPAPVTAGYGTSLLIDVFRLGGYTPIFLLFGWLEFPDRPWSGVHIGRVTFDGRFGDIELRNLPVVIGGSETGLLEHARDAYGPDADPLIPLPEAQADPDLQGEPGIVPKAGGLTTVANDATTLPLTFTALSGLEQSVGVLLQTASVPFRVVGEDSSLSFDPSSYFFYQDNRRCYFVEGSRYYQWGSAWLPVPPSDPSTSPFEVRYQFHRFYHPFTRLLWHQLSAGGFPALYEREVQSTPDAVDPSGADVFSFSATYAPVSTRVTWGQNNEIIDFSPDAPYSVYNWELFYHAPLLIAEQLSQNQQFEDALTWFHFIFDPTRQGPEPTPQRFWITEPLNTLTAPAILSEQINNLLLLVNRADPGAVAQVQSWRQDPFNPFRLADQRPVAYMKRVVMSYLDTVIAWADNLFSTDSREALNEATLLYVLAGEILGPRPQAVVPPQHMDASFDYLEPLLDAFADAMVSIENYVPAGGGAGGGGGGGAPMPAPQTFYFKVPPNDRLLGYWDTVADRLFKLRHCENIAGVQRQLPLFDAPIDPGLLVAAQAAGVDIGSVLADLQTARPGYRFTALYAQALDFCNAVTAYGASLLAALQQRDAAGLAQLLTGQQQQIETENGAVLQAQVDAAAQDVAALEQALALAQAQQNFNAGRPFANPWEVIALAMKATLAGVNLGVGLVYLLAGGLRAIPDFGLGVAGFGGSPSADATTGGGAVSTALAHAADAGKAFATGLDKGSDASAIAGALQERKEQNTEKALEAGIQIQQVQAQIAAARIRHDLAAQQLANHENQLTRLQQQIDYLTAMFSSEDLYDWMIGKLSDTYFSSYRTAYKLCQQAERCYRYELGLTTSSFVQFGYWDSLKKGLQAGESLTKDLRRMQASYLEQNARRFEISRYVSLATLDPHAVLTLLEHGACDIELPETLFDNDYPGHYQRRLQRVSVTVVYPNPGRFDNVKCTLTMTHNSVRTTTDLSSGYRRQGQSDARFVDEFGAVPQKIALGNAQDDPGLFLTDLTDNLGDPRYLPFEGAGAISTWHLELPAQTNEIDLASVTDVVLHLHYTALDGGTSFQQAVQADNAAHAPTSGAVLLDVADRFAPAWQQFLGAATGDSDQVLTVSVSAAAFPPWTRGKAITVTGLTAFAASTQSGQFVLQPQAPLPTTNLVMAPLAGVSEPNIVTASVTPPPSGPGTWSFKLRSSSAADFRSLTADGIGDLLLLVAFATA